MEQGHLIWNAGRVLARYLETHAAELVRDKTVLEFGAGAGLPSIVCAVNGAQTVVCTDYPDPDLIENLHLNVENCRHDISKPTISVQGFLWGSPVDKLTAPLDDPVSGFDLLLLADILFNHSEHEKLAASVEATLKRTVDARALVFFTPYRPWLLEKDLRFFELVQARGFKVEKICETVMDRVMFENDPGDEMLRRTVFGYEVRRRL